MGTVIYLDIRLFPYLDLDGNNRETVTSYFFTITK